ncbi:MAG: hypothetical protein HDQ88_11670 [Clostridia bacterium]|nr:hypothetical protein [Clostridia bacterium]
MFKFYYEKRKNKSGGYFDVIYVDLGYRLMFLCFDRSAIAEILGLSVADLYTIAPDTKVEIGEINGSKLKVK